MLRCGRRVGALVAVLVGVLALAMGCAEDKRLDLESAELCSARQALLAKEGQYGFALPEKTLSLTFDDGPAERTRELSEYLKEQGVFVTFFINGSWVTGDFEPQAAILDQLAADGHLVANHTTSHKALSNLTPEEIVAEVEQTDDVIEQHTPPGKRYFRPPYGDWNDKTASVLAASPMKKYFGPVHWDIGDKLSDKGAADWDCWDDEGNGKKTVEECGDLYLKEIRAKRRGIVLMHDGPPFSPNPMSVDLVKYVLPILKAEGFKFVRLDAVPLRGLPPPKADDPAGNNGGGTGQAVDAGARRPASDPCRATPASMPFPVDEHTYACGPRKHRH
jgi:peptidoglycan-N-acetylglucosamine deacetylase